MLIPLAKELGSSAGRELRTRPVMSTGWLRGRVKAVTSGDCLVIVGNVKAGPPPEKTITLASLMAPKLVSMWLATGP